MSRRIKLAVVLVSLGSAVAIYCLAHTTPHSMTAFFFVSLPCFGLAALLYLTIFVQFVAVSLNLIRRRSGG